MKLAFTLMALLVVLGFLTGPVLLIWSLNTLFHLGIAYNLKTWFASFVLWWAFNAEMLNNKIYGKEN
tara:strand:- start:1434 stop:1634 length:201 start_codon:yes stop_codon:yes gene_type:complete